MENLSVEDVFSFLEDSDLHEVAVIFKENDIDGVALEEMLKEEPQNSIKELIPKMGPRLRTLRAVENNGKPIAQQKPARVASQDSEHVSASFKGQLKLRMDDGQWSMEKMDEIELKELGNAGDAKGKLEEASKIYGLKDKSRLLTNYEKL
ncbi:Hypothetical predicted protein [Paramuricea clavata]|uniref:Uncharacterized protein n=1 Tax=Paramuricea clavata TaxID=317549 RepID=A0A6S7GWG7_PARCT|nr:Hypothetical predicted protein [Paramuricea clavata]